ncbi:MAG: Spy/CpxP family protein refolding chaperone [Candidatus Stygibacter frigidus]|nr:Spy/CpxP family protein refolding chaperone [Candidatus Stygibacter frigidus]
MKKLLVIVAILLIATAVFAHNHLNREMDCQKGQGRENGRMGMMDKGRMGLQGKGNPGNRMMMIMHQLELTEDQQEQLGDQHVKMQKTVIEMNAQIKTLEIDAEVALKEMDFTQIKKVSNAIFDLKKELKGKQIDSHEKCWNILTAEQKDQAKELMMHPQKMMRDKMGERQGDKMGMRQHRGMMDDDDNEMEDGD